MIRGRSNIPHLRQTSAPAAPAAPGGGGAAGSLTRPPSGPAPGPFPRCPSLRCREGGGRYGNRRVIPHVWADRVGVVSCRWSRRQVGRVCATAGPGGRPPGRSAAAFLMGFGLAAARAQPRRAALYAMRCSQCPAPRCRRSGRSSGRPTGRRPARLAASSSLPSEPPGPPQQPSRCQSRATCSSKARAVAAAQTLDQGGFRTAGRRLVSWVGSSFPQ